MPTQVFCHGMCNWCMCLFAETFVELQSVCLCATVTRPLARSAPSSGDMHQCCTHSLILRRKVGLGQRRAGPSHVAFVSLPGHV